LDHQFNKGHSVKFMERFLLQMFIHDTMYKNRIIKIISPRIMWDLNH
jgi:hypothetical protein